MAARLNSRTGSSTFVTTDVTLVLSVVNHVRTFACVWLVYATVVEVTTVVTPLPIWVVPCVGVTTVDVAVLPTTTVLVTLVVIVEETETVVETVEVVSAKVTWKLTGKFGIWKVHVYPI